MTDSCSAITVLGQAYAPLWIFGLFWLLFAFCFGACVGSFINVLVYRLPSGMSVISPPSRCPTCGARLTWRENLPVIGWLLLRGKCKYCGERISPEYLLVETFVGLVFVLLALVYYYIPPSTPWWGEIGGPWWYWNGVYTLPAFVAILIMVGGLIAMTLIDARTFTIPIQIPVFVTVAAFLMYAIQPLLPVQPKFSPSPQVWPIPTPSRAGFGAATGGVLGILISYLLLRLGLFRHSFLDYDEYIDQPLVPGAPPEPEGGGMLRETGLRVLFYLPPTMLGLGAWWLSQSEIVIGACAIAGIVIGGIAVHWLSKGGPAETAQDRAAAANLAPEYPHARREMLIELLFLLPCIGLMVAGYFAGHSLPNVSPAVAQWLQAMGATFLGFLVGGGIIWGIRIIFSLILGREAMGMGDVHLLAAVGAVLGYRDPVFIFVFSCFVALAYTLPGLFMRGIRRELPLGPHLAAATVLVILLHPVLLGWWNRIIQALSVLFPTP